MRRRFLMLVSSSYWSQFHSGFVGPDTQQDLQEVCRMCIDRIVKYEDPKKIKGLRDPCVNPAITDNEVYILTC